jgi:hypothetical protein
MGFFTQDEVEHFKENGFVRKYDVVDRRLLDKAVDKFYEEIDVDRADPSSFVKAGPQQSNLGVGSDPDVRATLTESPLQEMCEELVGDDLAVSNHTFAKPIYPTGRPRSEWSHPEHGHLDGYTADGVVDTFTIAVTVNMNDIKPKSGAFTVWPGTHRRAHCYFQEHSLVNGLKAFQDDEGNYVDLPEAVENPGPPGTVVFWHNLLMHQPGNNHGEDIRMACVSRFRRKDLTDIKFEVPEDMWQYWKI